MRALAAGGNAIDAAVTTALTLGVVDSHNSGIGGGCFIMYYDKASDKVTSYMRAEMRATAERTNRDVKIAEAMVDERIDVPGLSVEAGRRRSGAGLDTRDVRVSAPASACW